MEPRRAPPLTRVETSKGNEKEGESYWSKSERDGVTEPRGEGVVSYAECCREDRERTSVSTGFNNMGSLGTLARSL